MYSQFMMHGQKNIKLHRFLPGLKKYAVSISWVGNCHAEDEDGRFIRSEMNS